MKRILSVSVPREAANMKKGERGQALVITLILVALGGVVITPFLSHVGTSLIGSQVYRESITRQYSGDAGVEHAIWDLTYGDLATQLPSIGDSISYELGEMINGYIPDITVVRSGNLTYEITSQAGDETVSAGIEITGQTARVLRWQIT
jgi:hypothetical protein